MLLFQEVPQFCSWAVVDEVKAAGVAVVSRFESRSGCRCVPPVSQLGEVGAMALSACNNVGVLAVHLGLHGVLLGHKGKVIVDPEQIGVTMIIVKSFEASTARLVASSPGMAKWLPVRVTLHLDSSGFSMRPP